MLGIYRVAAHRVAYRVVLSSTELVSSLSTGRLKGSGDGTSLHHKYSDMELLSSCFRPCAAFQFEASSACSDVKSLRLNAEYRINSSGILRLSENWKTAAKKRNSVAFSP
jgi:hypothetical protein